MDDSKLNGGIREDRAASARRAAQLRAGGLTLKQIAARIGCSEGEASKLVRFGLEQRR
jgi:hypothetical protein